MRSAQCLMLRGRCGAQQAAQCHARRNDPCADARAACAGEAAQRPRASGRVRVAPLAYWANQSLRRDPLNGGAFAVHAGFPDQLAAAGMPGLRAAPAGAPRGARKVKREPAGEGARPGPPAPGAAAAAGPVAAGGAGAAGAEGRAPAPGAGIGAGPAPIVKRGPGRPRKHPPDGVFCFAAVARADHGSAPLTPASTRSCWTQTRWA